MNISKNTLLAMLVLCVIIGISSCVKDSKPYDCTGVAPTYTTDIKAILDSKCVSCHNATDLEGGIDLSTYAVSKVQSARDCFTGCVQHLAPYHNMPQGEAKMPDATIKKIYCWVQNGAAL